jgi:hypothetical protein
MTGTAGPRGVMNPELRASAARDPDLTALREAGRLTTLLT